LDVIENFLLNQVENLFVFFISFPITKRTWKISEEKQKSVGKKMMKSGV
jgi:hypothetical protein